MESVEFDKSIANKLVNDVLKTVPSRLVEWEEIEKTLRKLLRHYFYQMHFVHAKMDEETFMEFVKVRLESITNLAYSDVTAMLYADTTKSEKATKSEKTDSEIKLDKCDSVDEEKK